MAALINVDDIEKKIGLATAKTRESFEAMNGADTSANLALTVARDAQQVTHRDGLDAPFFIRPLPPFLPHLNKGTQPVPTMITE